MSVTDMWPRFADLAAPGRQVRVVVCPVTNASAELTVGFSTLLQPFEQDRMARLSHDRDRIAFAQAHLLLRRCLWSVTGRWDWPFARSNFGKPELSPPWGTRALNFNLTHSTDMVACALAMGVDVGIDAEADYLQADCLELADQHFTPDESAWLGSRPAHARGAAFSSIWTMKEAVLKARGCGLHGDLREFSVDVEAQSVAFGIPESGYAWRTENRRYDGTSLCVAVRSSGQPLDSVEIFWQTVTVEQLANLLPEIATNACRAAHGSSIELS